MASQPQGPKWDELLQRPVRGLLCHPPRPPAFSGCSPPPGWLRGAGWGSLAGCPPWGAELCPAGEPCACFPNSSSVALSGKQRGLGTRCGFRFLISLLRALSACNFLQLRPLGMVPPLKTWPRRCSYLWGGGGAETACRLGPNYTAWSPKFGKFISALIGCPCHMRSGRTGLGSRNVCPKTGEDVLGKIRKAGVMPPVFTF